MVNGIMPNRRILLDKSVNMMPPEIINTNVDMFGEGKEIAANGKFDINWAKSVRSCTDLPKIGKNIECKFIAILAKHITQSGIIMTDIIGMASKFDNNPMQLNRLNVLIEKIDVANVAIMLDKNSEYIAADFVEFLRFPS